MLAWLRAMLLGESLILRALAGLARQLDKLEITVSANQDKLDAIAAQVSTATEDIRGDIQALKDQVAAGTPAEELDFSGLEGSVAKLDALDAENPATPATPAEPGDSTDVPAEGDDTLA